MGCGEYNVYQIQKYQVNENLGPFLSDSKVLKTIYLMDKLILYICCGS